MALSEAALGERQVARTYAEMTGEVLETESALLCALEQPSFRSSPGQRTLWLLPADLESARVADACGNLRVLRARTKRTR